MLRCLFPLLVCVLSTLTASAPAAMLTQDKALLGSQTAKAGFENEDQIRDMFLSWRSDPTAIQWLRHMNYRAEDVVDVQVDKPHGQKADIEVVVTTKSGMKVHGVSIKLVSSTRGFNQIDKRWVAQYAEMWSMPARVRSALEHFVGEIPPGQAGRSSSRQFLDEMDDATQADIISFFSQHKHRIVSDLLMGRGNHSADWLMVIWRSKATTRNDSWILVPTSKAVDFYSAGQVQITAAGSLKIGRITMQRKGGDNQRETAKMLQFKLNPLELMEHIQNRDNAVR